MKWNWKKSAIAGITAAALAAGGFGWYQWGHTSADPVYVYQFDFVGMTEYWGDSRESYGPVTSDRIQTVFLSETQTVKEILVEEGAAVKKGDVLMTFDTTLDALAVEKKRLETERAKLQLEDAEADLRRILGLKPSSPIDPVDPTEPDEGDPWKFEEMVTKDSSHNGQSAATPFIVWLESSETEFTYDFLRSIAAWGISKASAPLTESEPTEETQAETEPETEPETVPEETEAQETQGTEPTEETRPENPYDPEPEPETTYTEWEVRQILEQALREYLEEAPEPFDEDYYMVIKVTENNMSKGNKTMWQGIKVSGDGRDQLKFRFFDASSVEDPAMKDTVQKDDDLHWSDFENDKEEVIDYGSGMTAAEIAQMAAEQEKKIKELRLKYKMTEAEYKLMAKELGDGNIYAETDGVVMSIVDEEEAKANQQPVMKVSDGGGFYVEGSVSELEREKLSVGQEVTINSWDTGMSYTGSVVEIRDFPNSSNSFFGNGNPNATQYPFVAFVDGSADLREGDYVSISYSASGSENGIYLQMPFVRTEQGRSFVYVLGGNGRLEERTVTTGKSLWGSYVEILSGLSVSDQIAFPYGKNVRPGVKAVAGDLSNLYG